MGSKKDLVVISASGNAIAWTKPGQSAEGTFLSVDKEIGQNDSNLYHFEDEKGKEFSVWGAYQIDQVLSHARAGDYVRITWEGKKKIKGGKKVNVFKIEGSQDLMKRVEKSGAFEFAKKGKKISKK